MNLPKMKFPRRAPPAIEPCEEDIEFQVLDWYVPESDRSELAKRRARGYAAAERPDHPPEYTIMMHGVTEAGHTVLAEVHGHCPYFFLRMPDAWWKGKTNAYIKSKIADLKASLLQSKVERTKYNPNTKSRDTYFATVVPWRLQSHLDYMKLVWRKDFWGFTNGAEFPFIKVKVKSLALFQAISRYFAEPSMIKAGFVLYESNIDPFLRFIHERNLQPCGWVRLPAGTYDFVDDDDDGPISRAGYHVRVSSTSDVHPLHLNKIAPLLIASFDIECTSSHGDFPVARKDYRKLALDLVQAARAAPSEVKLDVVKSWILDAFKSGVHDTEAGVEIHPVFPKDKLDRARLEKRLAHVIEDVVLTLKDATMDRRSNSRDAIAEEEQDAIPKFTNALKDAAIKQLVELLGCYNDKQKWSGALPQLEGDPVIQIGTTVHRYGSDDIIYRHIVTLNSCSEIENADVEVQDSEENVLMAWKEMIQRLDPDVLIGYNIFGFDMKYVWERAQEVGAEDCFAVGLGRLNKRACILDERKLSSSALGDNIMHTFDLDGVVLIDLLKVMQRDHKLDSYKLDHVAATFLGDRKDDLKPREIFDRFQGDADDRCVIARYCLQDCALVNRLLHKLKVLENNVGMGNVCSVPLSYLFMRGQGIKIFSLVAKECRSKHHLIPVKAFREADSIPGEEEGYEGAIVLEPREGIYLDDPITVLDYSSLYPSSMIARNLSHDCYVNDTRYANLEDQGITYLTVEYDVYEGTGDKKHVVGKKACTFAQLPEGKKGIIPSILQQLLVARKNTRKKIGYERLFLSDGRVATGLVTDAGEGTLQIINIDNSDVGAGFAGHKAVVSNDLVIRREAAFHPFEQAILDALQLAYKITANSLYGQIGSRTSPIYWKDIAACTTATGREMIMLAKGFVEDRYGAEVVYGDSVTHRTPVLVRNRVTGAVSVQPIHALGKHIGWRPYEVFKPYDSAGSNRRHKQQREAMELDAWTDNGWSQIRRVIRHKCNKKVYRVSCRYGTVEVTEDHSLLDQQRALVKPEQLTPITELLHGFPSSDQLQKHVHPNQAPPQNVQIYGDILNAQTAFLSLRAQGLSNVQIRTHLDDMMYPSYVLTHGVDVGEVGVSVQLIYDTGEYDGYVYDIETTEGVFQAGVGDIIIKNTDSIFCKFPNRLDDGTLLKGRDALPLSIAAGQRTSREIKPFLPPPQCLEYEKTFYPFIIFSKKRYVGNLYEDDPNKTPKQKSMGIVLKRRDNAPLVKKVFGGIIDILLNKNDLDASVEFLATCLNDLVDGKYPLEDLVITKTIRAEYKDPSKIAHKVLADRMGERDPGNKPMVNDRIPFVYVVPPPGTEVKLQGDRIEHPEYITENKLTPDYRFYITNQLMKPICQLYALCVERLPGYDLTPEYWIQLDEEMKHQPLYTNPKKRKDRINTLKMRAAEAIMFEPHLEGLDEVKMVKSRKPSTNARQRSHALDASQMMRLTTEVRQVKRGRSYDVTVCLHAQGADDVVWETTSSQTGTKLNCTNKGVQSALLAIMKAKLVTAPLLLSGLDKAFVRAWKEAIKSNDTDTMVDDIKRALDTQDIGRIEELQQLQRLSPLAQLYHYLSCRFE